MEQLIIVFCIVLLGVLFYHTVSRMVDSSVPPLPEPEPCKYHDWWEIQDGPTGNFKTMCSKCMKTSQQIQEEMENDSN
jgi:hypothetical protein